MEVSGYPVGEYGSNVTNQPSQQNYPSNLTDLRSTSQSAPNDQILPGPSFQQTTPGGEDSQYEMPVTDINLQRPADEVNLSEKPPKVLRDKDANGAQGRWHKIEHQRFIEAIKKYGKDWKAVEQYIATRSGSQIRSHAQKFFNRIIKKYTIDKQEVINFIQTNYNLAESSGSTTPQKRPKKDSSKLLMKKIPDQNLAT
jgi:SHAQKYF class myb-like DNA-binding protein